MARRCGIFMAWPLVWLACGAPVRGADSQIVLGGLHNPCGIAVDAATGHVFVSNSGEGQVLRIHPMEIESSSATVVGFGKDTYGSDPQYQIGPLGLALIDEGRTLVVGGGDLPEGQDLVRAYAIPPSGTTLQADADVLWTAGPIPGNASHAGLGDFYGIAAGDQTLFVTCQGDDANGWVARLDLRGPNARRLTPLIATSALTKTAAPTAVAIAPGGELAVGQMGKVNLPGDSLLAFFEVGSGRLCARFQTGLHDVVALAFHPRTGELYALDFAWQEPAAGGLFRLDYDRQRGSCKAVKILALDKPTAMGFAPDGSLYVTVIGTSQVPDGIKPGQLLIITGDLEPPAP